MCWAASAFVAWFVQVPAHGGRALLLSSSLHLSILDSYLHPCLANTRLPPCSQPRVPSSQRSHPSLIVSLQPYSPQMCSVFSWPLFYGNLRLGGRREESLGGEEGSDPAIVLSQEVVGAIAFHWKHNKFKRRPKRTSLKLPLPDLPSALALLSSLPFLFFILFCIFSPLSPFSLASSYPLFFQ